jgi:hypothetical protein
MLYNADAKRTLPGLRIDAAELIERDGHPELRLRSGDNMLALSGLSDTFDPAAVGRLPGCTIKTAVVREDGPHALTLGFDDESVLTITPAGDRLDAVDEPY